MSITKADIHTAVLNRIRACGVAVNDMDGELVETLQDLSQQGRFLETSSDVTTVDGTATATAPTGCLSVKSAWISGGNPLDEISYNDYLQKIKNQTKSVTATYDYTGGTVELMLSGSTNDFEGLAVGDYVRITNTGTSSNMTIGSYAIASIDSTNSAYLGLSTDAGGASDDTGVSVTFLSVSQAEPDKFAIWDGSLYFYPTPDKVYPVTVDFYKLHAASSTTIEFPDEFKAAILYGVMVRLLEGQLVPADPNGNRLIYHENKYIQAINVLRSGHETQPVFVQYRDI